MEYCFNMLKSLTVAILLSSASVYAAPAPSCSTLIEEILDPACWKSPPPPSPKPGPVSMPESSAIPELLIWAGAVGFIALRQRRQRVS
jgi:hypothetical protein